MLRRHREGFLAMVVAGIRGAWRSLPDGRELRLLGGGMLPVGLLRLRRCLVLLLRLRRRLVLLLWLRWLSRDGRRRLGQRRLVGMHWLREVGIGRHGRVGRGDGSLLGLLLRLRVEVKGGTGIGGRGGADRVVRHWHG